MKTWGETWEFIECISHTTTVTNNNCEIVLHINVKTIRTYTIQRFLLFFQLFFFFNWSRIKFLWLENICHNIILSDEYYHVIHFITLSFEMNSSRDEMLMVCKRNWGIERKWIICFWFIWQIWNDNLTTSHQLYQLTWIFVNMQNPSSSFW